MRRAESGVLVEWAASQGRNPGRGIGRRIWHMRKKLMDALPRLPVHLDVSERNPDAMALVKRHGTRETLGWARMTLGTPPALPWQRIYGVTSFELG